jgi:hypothetical protein
VGEYVLCGTNSKLVIVIGHAITRSHSFGTNIEKQVLTPKNTQRWVNRFYISSNNNQLKIMQPNKQYIKP